MTGFAMKDKNKKQKRRDKLTPEQKSDRAAAADIVERLEQVQEELADLLYEFRYLKRYSELEDVAYITWRLDTLREKCSHFAEEGSWKSND